MRRVRGNSRIISRAWDLSWCVHLNTHRFETLLGIVTWLKKICIIWRFYILPNPLSLPLLIEFNVFPLESSTRLQERRFCYSSSKGERICGCRRKLHIHWQHSQKLWKIVGKIWRVSLETSDTDSIWTRILVNGKILWNATLASLPWELSKRNFVFLFLFYVAVNMIRQIKLAFVLNYYSGNFVKFECWTYQFFEPVWFQNAFVLFFSTRVT